MLTVSTFILKQLRHYAYTRGPLLSMVLAFFNPPLLNDEMELRRDALSPLLLEGSLGASVSGDGIDGGGGGPVQTG